MRQSRLRQLPSSCRRAPAHREVWAVFFQQGSASTSENKVARTARIQEWPDDLETVFSRSTHPTHPPAMHSGLRWQPRPGLVAVQAVCSSQNIDVRCCIPKLLILRGLKCSAESYTDKGQVTAHAREPAPALSAAAAPFHAVSKGDLSGTSHPQLGLELLPYSYSLDGDLPDDWMLVWNVLASGIAELLNISEY